MTFKLETGTITRMSDGPKQTQDEQEAHQAAETLLERSRRAAAKLASQAWSLEAEPELAQDLPEPEVELKPALPAESSTPAEHPIDSSLFPADVGSDADAPPLPTPIQILEALLFVGGLPLTWQQLATVLRGVTEEQFLGWIDQLNRKYRQQNRPYLIQPKPPGWLLSVKPAYLSLQEKLYGGPREVRLPAAAIDVLSLIAYRRPIPKGLLDTLYGSDTQTQIRQLLRLGLITMQPADDGTKSPAGYAPTARFLELFQLNSLDDLPELGPTSPWQRRESPPS